MSALGTTLMQALATGVMLFAAGLFAGAALHKFRTFTEFTGFVDGYRLLPKVLVQPASAFILAAEVAATLGALGLLPHLGYLPAQLLLAYAAAMGVNLYRGRSDIDCGCGGTPMPISYSAVARNLLLAAAFGWAAGSVDPLAFLQGDPALIAAITGFALCIGLFYAVFNQLEANRAIRRRLWQRSA